MCGRYTLFHDETTLTPLFQLESLPVVPRFNIAPSQEVLVIRGRADGSREGVDARWGLIPHWVKDPNAFKANLFNARAESAAEKPSFRDAFARSRCLVPASGFFEWKKTADGKRPHFIRRRDGSPFAFAGLWTLWGGGEQPLLSCTILTTRPNTLMSDLHDRMPVILDPADHQRWLDPSVRDPRMLEDLFAPFPDDALEAYEVSRRVGSPLYDGPELIERV